MENTVRKKLVALGLCFLLTGCFNAQELSGTESASSLIERIEKSSDNENYMVLRKVAEEFVVKHPEHPQIDVVRIKLLEAYVQSGKHKLAKAYAERLMKGALMRDEYREDVEYLQIRSLFEENHHWMAKLLHNYVTKSVSDYYILRNYQDLELMLPKIENFLDQYPNSQYTDAIELIQFRIREGLANNELTIAHHYLQKGNIEGVRNRLERYESNYPDVYSPLYEQIIAHPKLNTES